jgi:hypothetical protein
MDIGQSGRMPGNALVDSLDQGATALVCPVTKAHRLAFRRLGDQSNEEWK